jgi:hypothetical protein
MQVLKTFTSQDGKRRLEIYSDGRGFFSYEESCEAVEDIPDLGPELYWMTSYVSGLYDSEDAAVQDAIMTTPWLRENSN